ncbi:MurR/RpiR family transcriptional regulator [Parapusillimonas sp. JC17]|uniref:MurR/RpiR family transcriptional regulator n=1 Tax=Parapusillimonas sp. JC17 TaxID=3445768 RepID=UPI003FA11D10
MDAYFATHATGPSILVTNKNPPSAPSSLDTLSERIQRDFAAMTPQFQVGAKYLLDFPSEIPVASMRKVAAQAGVQPATLVRLAQSLGYPGWEDLKQVFVRSLHRPPRRYADQARELIRGKNPRNALDRAVMAQTDNIRQLSADNADRLPEAVKLLNRAKRVYVAGFRASFAPAFSFQYLYRLFRPTVAMLRGDAGTLEMELRALTATDAVVIIGFEPYSRESVRVADAARQAGCRIIAICDSVLSPLAQVADSTLLFSTETSSFFPSSASATALVELLIEQLLAKAGSQAVSGIEHAEDQLHRTGAYVSDKEKQIWGQTPNGV